MKNETILKRIQNCLNPMMTCFLKPWIAGHVLGLIVFANIGCNHLFYHPDSITYATPTELSLDYQEIEVASKDGVRLKVWKIKPPRANLVSTVLLQFHGNAENRTSHFLSMAWLASHGVELVTFDYRGYDGSTGIPSRSGLVDDGVAMLDWLEREYPNASRYVLGQSLGGAVAVTALAKSKASIDGLILESTFASYRGVARSVLARSFLLWPFQWLPWVVLSGEEDPIDYIDRIKIPILAFHDLQDPIVPVQAGLKLYNSFPANQLTLHTPEGKSHINACNDRREQGCKMILNFMKLPH